MKKYIVCILFIVALVSVGHAETRGINCAHGSGVWRVWYEVPEEPGDMATFYFKNETDTPAFNVRAVVSFWDYFDNSTGHADAKIGSGSVRGGDVLQLKKLIPERTTRVSCEIRWTDAYGVQIKN